MRIRNVQLSDLADLDAISEETEFLGSEYRYIHWALARYFGETSFAVEDSNRVVGFIFCVPTARADTLFVWELAVSKRYDGKLRGRDLFERAIQFAIDRGFERVEFSIDPSNRITINTIGRALSRRGLVMVKIGSSAPHHMAPRVELAESQDLYVIALDRRHV